MADNAKLEALAIIFTVPDGKDGKDDNTLLTCTVTGGGTQIAVLRDFAGTDEFKPGPDTKYYDLAVTTPVTKAVYRGSTTTLNFVPRGGVGHDTAVMVATLTARFGDDEEFVVTDSGERTYKNESHQSWVNQ